VAIAPGDSPIPLEAAQPGSRFAVAGAGYSVCDFPADRRPIDIGDYYADFLKIRSEFGSAQKKPFCETIK
jgi:hypothetical protein